MSMYRQLWLAIVVSTLLALTGSLLASLLSARSYLETQLSMKNTDNAAALALYSRSGFAEAGRRRGYYHSPGNPPVDALVMVKSLAAHGDAA